jgi:predicted O-linked N-acetylglucosamine transferase (SPINDLY family)
MVDYQFTDPVFVPPSKRSLFAEICYDLPCAITYEAPTFAPPIGDLPALSNGFVTFGSLNRFLKITPEVLDLWAQILQAIPGSHMFLKDGHLDDSRVQAQVYAAFAKHGIGTDRLELRGATFHQEHLASYNKVDIALDPFPQNGGITTWEALWMGTPLVALLGNKPPSRISGAILEALSLGEWVARNEVDYLECAVHHAKDLGVLAQFRKECRARISASPAGNPDLYTRAVEDAYRSMWARWISR